MGDEQIDGWTMGQVIKSANTKKIFIVYSLFKPVKLLFTSKFNSGLHKKKKNLLLKVKFMYIFYFILQMT